MSGTNNVESYRAERAALDAYLEALFADWQTRRARAVADFEDKWSDRLIELEEARRIEAKHRQDRQDSRAWRETVAILTDALPTRVGAEM